MQLPLGLQLHAAASFGLLVKIPQICVMSKGTPEISLDISFQTSGLSFSGIAGLQEIHGFWFPILRIALPACWSHQMLWSFHSRYVPLLQTVPVAHNTFIPVHQTCIRPSVRPSISVHPSLYNGKDLHAQQVTLIIAVGIATYCQHIATHSESPRFFSFKSRNPGITNNILNHTHQNHGNGKFPNGKARLRYPEPRWLGEHHGTQWSIQRYHRSYSSLLNKGTGKTSILLG